MAERGRRKSGVSRQTSQSVVVDPETINQLTKQSLADKTGIAPQQQRLLFPPFEGEEARNCPTLSASGDFSWFVTGKWEGVLLENGRTIGQLVEPGVRVERIPDYQVSGGATAAAAIHRLELSFEDWLPATGDRSSRGDRQPLRLTADDRFRQSSCRLLLFRRGQDGQARLFEAPCDFTGQELLQGHHYSLQLRERVENHKRKESSLDRLSAIQAVPGIVIPVSIEKGVWGLTADIQVEEKRLFISKLDLRCLVITPCAWMSSPDMPPMSARGGTLEAPERGVKGIRMQAATTSVHVPSQGGHAAPSDAGPGSQGASGSDSATLGGNIAGVPEFSLVCAADGIRQNQSGNASGSYTSPPHGRHTTSGRANGEVRTAGGSVGRSARGRGESAANGMKDSSHRASNGGAGAKWQNDRHGAGSDGVSDGNGAGNCHQSGEDAGSLGSISTASVESTGLALEETDCSEGTAELEPESPILSRVSTVDTGETSMETSDGLSSSSIQFDDNGSSDVSSTVMQPKPANGAMEGRSERRATPAKPASKDPGRSPVSPSTPDPKSVLIEMGFSNDRSDSSSSAGTAEVPAPTHRASRPAQPSRGSVPATRGWSGPRPGPAPAWPPQRQGQGFMHGPGRGLPPPVHASAGGQGYVPPPHIGYNYHPPPVPRYFPPYPPGRTFPPAAFSEWAGGYLVYPHGVMPPGVAPPDMFHVPHHPWAQPQFGPVAWETQASGPCPPLPLGQPGYPGSMGPHPWGSGPAMHTWGQQQVVPPIRYNRPRDTMRVPSSQERSRRSSARGNGPPFQNIDMGKRVARHQERALEGRPVQVMLTVGGRQDSNVPREQDVQEQQTEAKLATKPGVDSGSSENADCPMTLRRRPVCDLERSMLEFLPRLPSCPDGGRPDRDFSLGDVFETLEKASYFGCEVSAHGWPLGKSLAYFAPVLSACRLFVNAENAKQILIHMGDKKALVKYLMIPVCDCGDREAFKVVVASGQEERELTVYEVETPAGPERVVAVVDAAEKGHPHLRKPVFERLVELVGETARGSQLLVEPLANLHPASWFAIQWYPVYRLPSAPLKAEFLTFHSFQPVPLATTHFGAMKAEDVAQASSCSSDGGHILPIVGFRCKLPKEEHWLDMKGKMGPSSPSPRSNTCPDPMADLANLGLSNHAAELAYSHGLHLVKKAAGFEDFVFDDLRMFADISEV